MNKQRLVAKMAALTVLWIVVWFFVHGQAFRPYLYASFPESTAFVLWFMLTFVMTAAFEISFLVLLLRLEKVHDFRSYFRIERLDIQGVWISLGLGIFMTIVNVTFLWKFLLEPARNFLTYIGIAGDKIGLGTAEMVPQLSPFQASLLTVFLILFWWLEAPEELFFRGYIQNSLQKIVSKNAAVFLSALVWDVAHIWGLVNIVERFFYGLIYSFVFRLRQNTTPTMIDHPIGNRANILAFVVPQIWGMTITIQNPLSWVLYLIIYVALLLFAIACWRLFIRTHLFRRDAAG